MSGLDFSLMFSEGGATHQLGSLRSLRRAIENRLLARETLVTLIQGEESRTLRAGAVAELAPLFDEIIGALPKPVTEPEAQPDERPKDKKASGAARRAPVVAPDETAPDTADTPEVKPPPAATASPVLEVAANDAQARPEAAASDQAARDLGRTLRKILDRLPAPALWTGVVVALLATLFLLGQCAGGGLSKNGATSPEPVVVTLYVTRQTNVRPDVKAAEIGTVERGDVVRGVIQGAGDGDQWLQVSEGPHQGRWIWAGNLSPNPRPTLIERLDGSLVRALRPGVLRREGRDGRFTDHAVRVGDGLALLAYVAGDQVEVQMDGGGVGYVSAEVFRPDEQAQAEAEARRLAEQEAALQARSAARAEAEQARRRADEAARAVEPAVIDVPRTISPSDANWRLRLTPRLPSRLNLAGVSTLRASVSCVVGGDGGMSDCRLVSEQPRNSGYGTAALDAARSSRHYLDDRSGRPAQGRRIVLNYEADVGDLVSP